MRGVPREAVRACGDRHRRVGADHEAMFADVRLLEERDGLAVATSHDEVPRCSRRTNNPDQPNSEGVTIEIDSPFHRRARLCVFVGAERAAQAILFGD